MRVWLGLLATALLVLPSVARTAPLEAYGRLPSVEDVKISPDGSKLALVLTSGEDRRVLVLRAADNALLGGVGAGKIKVRNLIWADDDHLLITQSVAGQARGVISADSEWYLAQSYQVSTHKQQALLGEVQRSRAGPSDPAETMNVITTAPLVRHVKGRTLVFVQGINFLDHIGVECLIQIDLQANRSSLVEQGARDVKGWAVNASGDVVAEEKYDQAKGQWSLRVRQPGSAWINSRTVMASVDRPGLAGLGRDGDSVIVVAIESGENVYHEVSLATGAWGPATPDGFELLLHDPITGAFEGGRSLDGDRLTHTFFDPARQKHWDAITRAYPGEQVTLASRSDDFTKLVVLVDGPKDGEAYALVDLATKHAAWLGNVYDQITPADIGEQRPITYKAADGLTITGYLTLPPGRPAKGLPLVVFPHGGPAARDTPGFDWWAQAMASRGYAVLQPNFRGSAGISNALLEAGYGEYGRKMQTDLSDGVRFLAAQGLIDPKRVCIVGASYGGYAALAGVTLDLGVYRCAVSVAGPSDLRRKLHSESGHNDARQVESVRYWDRYMGAKGVDDPVLDARSPAKHADAVTAPVLLIHGKDDTVVPYEQSQIMADALKRAGKPVTFVTLKAEDHWLSRSDTRLQMLAETIAFLEANNPPN